MQLITWQEGYSVKIEKFDNHHKVLIDLINQLHDSMLQGKGKEILLSVFEELKKYTIYHFNAEEVLMKIHKYPDFEKHKSQHEFFIKRIDELKEAFNNNLKTATIDTFTFLKDWLIKHIQTTDKLYSDFFNKLNIK